MKTFQFCLREGVFLVYEGDTLGQAIKVATQDLLTLGIGIEEVIEINLL